MATRQEYDCIAPVDSMVMRVEKLIWSHPSGAPNMVLPDGGMAHLKG
jgi:hypothetical protein